jgi:hypothetical protein
MELCRIAALNVKVLKIERERSQQLMDDCMQSFILSQSIQNEIHHLCARETSRKNATMFTLTFQPTQPPSKIETPEKRSRIRRPVQTWILYYH